MLANLKGLVIADTQSKHVSVIDYQFKAMGYQLDRNKRSKANR
jgi:hypothetical protein